MCAVRDASPARTGELLGIWRGRQFPFFIVLGQENLLLQLKDESLYLLRSLITNYNRKKTGYFGTANSKISLNKNQTSKEFDQCLIKLVQFTNL